MPLFVFGPDFSRVLHPDLKLLVFGHHPPSDFRQNKKNSIITILDSDGEDDVNKIPEMIKNANQNFDKVIVSQRTKRKENFLFKSLYFTHKILTFIFTWSWISFGNYSSYHSSLLYYGLI